MTGLIGQSDGFKKQTGEHMQVMHQSMKEEVEGNVKSQLEDFTQKNRDTTDLLESISTQLQRLTKKVDSQNRKFQLLDDKLEAIESEALSTQRGFTKLQKNVNKKIQQFSEMFEGAKTSDDSSDDED
jgi:ABC-type transporter Mla subunit MlaD